MKSLKSIFPFFLVNTKNKCVKSEHFLSLSEMHSEMLLLCSEFFWIQTRRTPKTFLFALLFIKNKATTREEKTKTKPPTSSYTFATSSSPSMSSNRFFPFVSFSCFSCSNFCFAWSVLDAFRRDGRDDIFFSLFRFDSHFHKGQKNDRSMRALFDVSFSLQQQRKRERERCKKRL